MGPKVGVKMAAPGAAVPAQSSTAPAVDPRTVSFPSMEKIKVVPPSLVELCLKKIAAGFMRFDVNQLQKRTNKQLEDVFAILDCDVPLQTAATVIHDELYWRRRAMHRDRGEYTGVVDQHGMSWKQFFLETELQAILEKFALDFQPQELEELYGIILAVKP